MDQLFCDDEDNLDLRLGYLNNKEDALFGSALAAGSSAADTRQFQRMEALMMESPRSSLPTHITLPMQQISEPQHGDACTVALPSLRNSSISRVSGRPSTLQNTLMKPSIGILSRPFRVPGLAGNQRSVQHGDAGQSRNLDESPMFSVTMQPPPASTRAPADRPQQRAVAAGLQRRSPAINGTAQGNAVIAAQDATAASSDRVAKRQRTMLGYAREVFTARLRQHQLLWRTCFGADSAGADNSAGRAYDHRIAQNCGVDVLYRSWEENLPTPICQLTQQASGRSVLVQACAGAHPFTPAGVARQEAASGTSLCHC